ncbi:hypothetical protein DPMN_054065 [Dreissena polymorpha]|uniref:Uncharacterized protein n=1 Tax=Dreissena polymorpha TaxID=45954 RepID=A0A9D4CMI9_DREPO|nr:hypothetical protein DPMN_054065 [Dreissena polymorpha]
MYDCEAAPVPLFMFSTQAEENVFIHVLGFGLFACEQLRGKYFNFEPKALRPRRGISGGPSRIQETPHFQRRSCFFKVPGVEQRYTAPPFNVPRGRHVAASSPVFSIAPVITTQFYKMFRPICAYETLFCL